MCRFAIDPVGGVTGSGVIASLGHGERCLLYGSLTDEPVFLQPRLAIGNDLRVEGFWLGSWAKKQRILTMLKLFRQVGELMRRRSVPDAVRRNLPPRTSRKGDGTAPLPLARAEGAAEDRR